MRHSSIFMLSVIILNNGCIEGDRSSVNVVKPPTTEATLLYHDDIGNDHAIEYHVLGGATLAVRETLPIDGGETPLLDKVGRAESLTAVFQRIHPTIAAPQILVAADRDSAAQQALFAKMPPPDMSPLPAGREMTSFVTCSPDYYADNWGANWFLDNYCHEGNFRECHTNVGSFDNWQQTSWNSYRQFEGDFNTSGRISGYYWSCFWSLFTGWVCNWLPTFDHDLLPRYVENWTITGAHDGWVRFTGNSPCGHLGVAFLWNN